MTTDPTSRHLDPLLDTEGFGSPTFNIGLWGPDRETKGEPDWLWCSWNQSDETREKFERVVREGDFAGPNLRIFPASDGWTPDTVLEEMNLRVVAHSPLDVGLNDDDIVERALGVCCG